MNKTQTTQTTVTKVEGTARTKAIGPMVERTPVLSRVDALLAARYAEIVREGGSVGPDIDRSLFPMVIVSNSTLDWSEYSDSDAE